MIIVLQGWGGSLGTPKSVCVIYVRPHRNTKENTPLPAWPTPYFSIDYHNLGGDRHQKFINGVRSKHEIYKKMHEFLYTYIVFFIKLRQGKAEDMILGPGFSLVRYILEFSQCPAWCLCRSARIGYC